MAEEKKKSMFVENEMLWAYFACGAFVVAVLLRFVWQQDGMTDRFDWERWRLLGVAAVFGFGLGWLFYPRPLWFLSGK